jgi:predicted RNA binding protein YcfA (HicA-like mRNA interferase family)
MPKLPPITARKFIKIIKKKGFLYNRTAGSHHIYINPKTQTTISIPVHSGKTLGKGLLHQLLKDADISPTEL